MLAPGGGIAARDLRLASPAADAAASRFTSPGEVYARDDFVYWGFTSESIRRLGALAGFQTWDLADAPLIDGHPRLIGALRVRE